MPIEGPIQELGVSDLLQLLCVSRRTGRLDAVQTGSARSLSLHLEEGTLVGVTGSPTELRLGRLAALSGVTSEADVTRALTHQRSAPGRRIGELLLEQGAIAESEVRRLIRFQIEQAILELLRWEEGQLSFAEEAAPRNGTIEIRLPTDTLLLDLVRRLDELTEVTGAPSGSEVVPRLADRSAESGSPLNLRPLEWAVLAEIDGARSLTALARSLGRDELEVARALGSLGEAGIVELVAARDLPTPLAKPVPERGGSAVARRSDPLRLAADALAEGRLEEADERIERLLIREPASAAVHTLKGMVMERRGNDHDGLRHFHRAIELDPLHEEAYFQLATALVRRGELAGARREIDTFLALASPDHPRRRSAEVLLAGLTQTLDALEEIA